MRSKRKGDVKALKPCKPSKNGDKQAGVADKSKVEVGGVAALSSEGRKKLVMGRIISRIASDDTVLEAAAKRRKRGSGG